MCKKIVPLLRLYIAAMQIANKNNELNKTHLYTVTFNLVRWTKTEFYICFYAFLLLFLCILLCSFIHQRLFFICIFLQNYHSLDAIFKTFIDVLCYRCQFSNYVCLQVIELLTVSISFTLAVAFIDANFLRSFADLLVGIAS